MEAPRMTGGVVGLDPSLSSTGLAHITPEGKLTVCNITSAGRQNEPLRATVDRVFEIANQAVDWITDHKPDLVVIENPSYGSRFGKPHERAFLWWAIVGALVNDGYPVARVAPQTRAIYATGAGNSNKATVLAFVREMYTDHLGYRVANDDVADAIVLADLGALREGYPLVEFDETHTRAEGSVLWPVP